MITTPLLIEQHFHGAYGVDFNTANEDDVIFLSTKLVEHGIGGFFPTLVTDSLNNLKKQIEVIKKASKNTKNNSAKILGIHIEGVFLNPLKKGIHNEKLFLEPNIDNYKLIEDDFIKIVTLAPELDNGLIDYLRKKNVKVQAGHCVGGNLQNIDGTTHTYNAMSPITHRGESTTLSALINDNIYSEVIADGFHVSDEALNLLFKVKPKDKIILVSDSLPITKSNISKTIFAGKEIYYDGKLATSIDGTIAGSTTLLDEIVKKLVKLNLFDTRFIENPYKYHNIEPFGEITWNSDYTIKKVTI